MVKQEKIDSNRPLPERLGSEYWETSAKLILERFYPDHFSDLSVDGESPDLQNDKIGVEVMNIESSVSQEIGSLYSRKYTYGDVSQRERAARRIRALGGVIGDFYLLHPTYNRDLGRIYKAVENKVQKLNTNYRVFQENNLFLFSEELILDQEMQDIFGRIVDCMSQHRVVFDSIYLCYLGGDFYEFNIKDNSYGHIEDSNSIIQTALVDARKVLESKYSK